MLLDPAEPEHLILLRYLDKMPQSLFELLGAVARPVNKCDSNPLVGF